MWQLQRRIDNQILGVTGLITPSVSVSLWCGGEVFGHLYFLKLFVLVLQVELKFRVGDIIYVYGDMDEDGFFTVSDSVIS